MYPWCNHRFQAKRKKKILIWVKHLPILPPKFFIEVKHNQIMGPLRGDVGTKQKSHVKYLISLWGSFIIFSFFKKGVDISKWSGINDFNFTFIEGSSANFFLHPWKWPFIKGTTLPSLLVWNSSLATAVGRQKVLWVLLSSHWAFVSNEGEKQMSRDAFHQWQKN